MASTETIEWDIGSHYKAAGVLAYARRPTRSPARSEGSPPADDELVGLVLCEFREKELQLMFPGGKVDPADLQNPFRTAFREFTEETRNILQLDESSIVDQFVTRFPSNCFYAPYGKYLLAAIEVPYLENPYKVFLENPIFEDITTDILWLNLSTLLEKNPTITHQSQEYKWHRFTSTLLSDNKMKDVIKNIITKGQQRDAAPATPTPAGGVSESSSDVEVDLSSAVAGLKI